MGNRARASRLLRRLALVAATYYLAARFGLSVGTLPGAVSPVWPPTGVAIAAVYLWGPKMLPAVFAGEALVMSHQGSDVWFVTVLPAVGNVVEAYVGATILRRCRVAPTLSRLRSVGVLVIGVGLGATTISATIGVGALVAAGVTTSADAWDSWRVWWIGNALGAIVVVPFVLSWSDRGRRSRTEGSRAELAALIAVFAAAFAVSFAGSRAATLLVFPLVAWAGLRFGTRGASALTLVAATIAVQRSAVGAGRFVTGDPVEDVFLIDTFLGVLSLTGLLLAALVTERARVQRALEVANADLEARVAERTNALRVDRFRLEQAQRVALIGSWEWDLRTDVVTASAELDRLFDEPRRPYGADFRVYAGKLMTEDLRAINRSIRHAQTHGGTFKSDCRMQLPDGTVRWLRIRGEADGAPGEIVRLHGSAQDVTDAKVKEAVIRANEERSAAIVGASAEAFVSMDSDERIVDWNSQAESTFGWRREEVLGESLFELIVPGAYRHAHRAGVARLMETGETQVLNTRREVTAVHRDGHEFPIEMAVWMTPGADGRAMFHAFLHDISERQADKAKLALALDEAREASRMKSAFLANMSHEIRTPMNGVLGMVGFLLDTELDEVQRDYVQTMAASAEALMGVINDVLDVSKIEAGKLEIEEGDFDLRRLLRDTLAPFTPTATEKNLTLTATVEHTIPDVIRGDRLRLRQVVGNLVSNAMKFTAIGSVEVTVGLRADTLLFEVTDSGIGIPPERRAQLFEPFTQADASTTRRYGGTGLGLAISRQLVSLMGGDIGVTPAAGGGSRFWFSIPLLRAAVVALPAATDARARTTRFCGAGRRVLVAEDNPVNRKVAVGMLEHLGYTVDIAVDGVEAVNAFVPGAFDAILMDCQMPHMDGYDATRAIRGRETSARTPIIAMTASAMASDRERCIAAGMDDFLSKPIGTEKLGATLENWTTPSSSAAAPASVGDAAPYDHAAAEHLRSLDDDGSFLLELLQMFRSDSHDLLTNLQAAVASGDTATVKGLAHQLKGSTGLLGLRALSAECAKLEAGADSIVFAAGQIASVLDEYQRALAYLGDLAARTAA